MLSVVPEKWHHTVVTRPEWVRGALLNYEDVFDTEWIAKNHGPNNTSLKVPRGLQRVVGMREKHD